MAKKFRSVVDLDAKTHRRLVAITKKNYITRSALLRRLVDAYLKSKGKLNG